MFGRNKRSKEGSRMNQTNPGPGSYTSPENTLKSKVGGLFGKERQRPGFSNPRSKAPGPGEYAAKTYVGKDTPGYSLSPRRPVTQGQAMGPGPGGYDPRFEKGQ